jgi:lantibiotic modifying enzyme
MLPYSSLLQEDSLEDWISSVLDPAHKALSRLKVIDRISAHELRQSRAADMLRSSFMARHHLSQRIHSFISELPSDKALIARVRSRDKAISHFLTDVDAISTRIFKNDHNITIKELASDTHNGGRCPLLLNTPRGKFVLKFADPRTYLLLADIAAYIEKITGFSLSMPSVEACDLEKYAWYIIPYIPEWGANKQSDVAAFMESSGALVALAFMLRIVDIHLENVLVWNGYPIIIDPECILYPLDELLQEDRLLSTGLLCENMNLSALRGNTLPLLSLGHHVDKRGILHYRRPTTGLNHRLHNKSCGSYVEPADYSTTILAAFETTYKVFISHAEELSNRITHFVKDDFRIRCLIRKTQHYAMAIEMLNLPQTHSDNTHYDLVLDRFRKSGSLCPMTESIFLAEKSDLNLGDIPYFWYRAGDTAIHHHTGIVYAEALRSPIKDQIPTLFNTLSLSDLELHLSMFKKFLKAPIHA